MTLKRKLGIAATLAAVVLAVGLCWPKPKGYTYQGKTAEKWFEEYVALITNKDAKKDAQNIAVHLHAFKAMGTNSFQN